MKCSGAPERHSRNQYVFIIIAAATSTAPHGQAHWGRTSSPAAWLIPCLPADGPQLCLGDQCHHISLSLLVAVAWPFTALSETQRLMVHGCALLSLLTEGATQETQEGVFPSQSLLSGGAASLLPGSPDPFGCHGFYAILALRGCPLAHLEEGCGHSKKPSGIVHVWKQE